MASRDPSSLSRDEELFPSSPATPRPSEKAHGLLEILPDKIDIEEEVRLYDELCDVRAYASACPPILMTKTIVAGRSSIVSFTFSSPGTLSVLARHMASRQHR